MAFIPGTKKQLTVSTDDGRINKHISNIQDINGRRLSFYDREVPSGLISGGEVTNPSGLDITIQAGNGEVNGNPYSWGLTNLTVTPELFQLVCYDPVAGSVIVSVNDQELFARSIHLAWIYAGLTVIARVLPIQEDGKYIFVKKQIPDGGGGWEWDDKEDLLMGGEQPNALYDTSNDRIYLSYRKNSILFQRIIEVGNEADAWTYKVDYTVSVNTIYLQTDPSSGAFTFYSGCIETDRSLSNQQEQLYAPRTPEEPSVSYSGSKQAFPRSNTSNFFTYIIGNGNDGFFANPGQDVKYVMVVPSVNLTKPGEVDFIEIYTVVAGSHVLQESIPISESYTVKDLSSYSGALYIGWRGTLSGSSYTLPEEQRQHIFIDQSDYIYQSSPTQLNASGSRLGLTIYSGSSEINKTISDVLEQKYTSPPIDYAQGTYYSGAVSIKRVLS